MEVAGCYCFCTEKVLFLKRHLNKPYGKTWGVPAGKLEKGESPRHAVIREVLEEAGIDINDDKLMEIQPLYCRIPDLDFIYHIFIKLFDDYPPILLSTEEHTEYKWVTTQEALKLPLIVGGSEALLYVIQCRQQM